MDRCWILIGMMGSGKSSIGRQLADITGRPFEDTDSMLERRFGRSVSQIFKIYGEEAFRGHETSILNSIEPHACILATGGGIVLRDANWDEMRRLGTTIYLHAESETLMQRLEHSKRKRPLLEVDDWEQRIKELMNAREPLYQKADLVVDTGDEPIETVALRVKESIERFEQGM